MGRCYLTAVGYRTQWQWSVYWTPGSQFADTLAEAQAKFKVAYEASEEFGKPSRPSRGSS